ncbi:hypothetical protein CHS0354_020688 [Potamilus streckersoni]|uniref:Phosducin domain-containing protein n=1 Tax=Potamilus streckersoni TaxID=2493646 RepID=A0AAE0TFK9_9BIVA|nr:hypothetical protein CHS0354_020688 [Potamilus streckersoni]
MQDPNADTEWNDILRAKGILAPKEKEVSEEDVIDILESTIQEKSRGKQLEDLTLDELNENEDEIDEEDERIFEAYRMQRLSEMQAASLRAKFGEVREITREDYVREVNKAGDGVWIVLHVYKQGIPLCTLINQHMTRLAQKFPESKFLKSISSVCIPNYPDKNLPTIFIYFEGELKKQFVGPHEFGGMNLTFSEFEWMISQTGAVKTDMEESPKRQIKDVMNIAIRESAINRDDSDDDDY